MNDVLDSRLCALLRREAERLGEERGRRGFKAEEAADAALVKAMTLSPGTKTQVRARLLGLVEEALDGPMHAPPAEPSPNASVEEVHEYIEALGVYEAKLKADRDQMKWIGAEAERRGLGPDMQLKDVFTKDELAKLPRWAALPPRKGAKS